VSDRKDHLRTTSHAELLRLAVDADCILLAIGQFWPAPCTNRRLGMFSISAAAFDCLADAWITLEELDALDAALRSRGVVRTGEWDVMYATPWSFAWTTDSGAFSLWDRSGRLLWIDGSMIMRRGAGAVARDAIEHVHAFLEDAWVKRGVALVAKDGTRHSVAVEEDPISKLDPTYDGISIMLEAGWAVSLATAIAAALGVPMKKDEPL